eukprot:TRINITY_DN257_c0_g1_i2.p1 TRINITY_DN257_c0_g1~~TRINITY_DN257_c0_g1_i2.p1  ORF type:complete len:913 (+),score=229.40 TRINITY_DN257_c0_g1_i2:239-2740(+)
MVDYIIVRSPTKTYVFPCYRWLAKEKDDGAVARDLFPGELKTEAPAKPVVKEPPPPPIPYHVTVATADEEGAGTSEDVFIKMTGQDGLSSGKIHLQVLVDGKKCNFERGKKDTFDIELPDLGDLQKLTVSHSNKAPGAQWMVDYITVETPSKKWNFPCYRWLAASKDDGAVSRDLVPGELQEDESESEEPPEIPYHVIVATADEDGAETHENVFLKMFSDEDNSGKIGLEVLVDGKPHFFERGKKDTFDVDLSDLGELKKITVWHMGTTPKPSWLLDYVTVETPTKRWDFPCYRWLAKDKDDGAISRDLVPGALRKEEEVVAPEIPYHVTVATADEEGAETHEDVFIKMVGTPRPGRGRKVAPTSGKIQLEVLVGEVKHFFDRGKKDTFDIDLKDLGDITSLTVWHSNKAPHAQWMLNYIIVESPTKRFEFPCYRWLAAHKDDGAVSRDLVPGPLRPDIPKTKVVIPDIPYRVTVVTADEEDAGTHEDVFIRMVGKNGVSSGKIQLEILVDNVKHFFERGKTDFFEIELPDIGDIATLTVWHGNKSAGAQWMLDYIVVEVKGNKYEFPCYRWLASHKEDGAVLRELVPGVLRPVVPKTKVVVPDIPYHLTVATADEEGAETHEDVFVRMVGTPPSGKGPKPTSGKINLEVMVGNTKHFFDRGKKDTFDLDLPDLGDITSLTVWHANQAPNAQWKLDYIVVESPTKKFEFPYSALIPLLHVEGVLLAPVKEVFHFPNKDLELYLATRRGDLSPSARARGAHHLDKDVLMRFCPFLVCGSDRHVVRNLRRHYLFFFSKCARDQISGYSPVILVLRKPPVAREIPPLGWCLHCDVV